jgi:hypothetical protein
MGFWLEEILKGALLGSNSAVRRDKTVKYMFRKVRKIKRAGS